MFLIFELCVHEIMEYTFLENWDLVFKIYIVCEVYPCGGRLVVSPIFAAFVAFLSLNVPHFICPFSFWWILRLFAVFGCYENCYLFKLVFDIVLLFLSSIPLLILICFSKFVKWSMTSFHPTKAYIQIDSCYYAILKKSNCLGGRKEMWVCLKLEVLMK